MMENLICFPRLLMLLIPACLPALDQSGSRGALPQRHRGDVEKCWRRAQDNTGGAGCYRNQLHFLAFHSAAAWLQVSHITLTLLSSSAAEWGQMHQSVLRETALIVSSPFVSP